MGSDLDRYFFVEADELMGELGRSLLELASAPESAPLVVRALRVTHTLKGAARIAKHSEVATATHAMEEVLLPYRDAALRVPRAVADDLLARLDALKADLVRAEHGGELPRPMAPAAMTAPPAVEELTRTLRVDMEQMDALVATVDQLTMQTRALRRQLPALEHAASLARALVQQGGSSTSRTRSIAEELRTTIDAVGRSWTTTADQLGVEIGQVRDAADRLRLLRADVAFDVLARAVHDAASAEGKSVVLHVTGGDVRVEAPVLVPLRDAMLHVVRNAVAHGVESPAERLAAGKPAQATIELTVVRERDRITIACTDDGNGIDVEAVRRVASERGLLPAGGVWTMEQAVAVLLRGGVSTMRDATELAGRGVGLDTVHDGVRQLGGSVRVRSDPGVGTTVFLVAPISLAALSGVEVEADGVRAAIPLESVARVLRFTAEDAAAHDGTIVDAGVALPVVRLGEVLTKGSRSERRISCAVVVEAKGRRVAVLVDRIHGIFHAVLRPFPSFVDAEPFIAGASLDAQGRAHLVLDANGIVDLADTVPADAKARARPKLPLLVIDDSMTTRMLEQSILLSAGYAVDCASSAEEGLALARQRRYGVFVVDVEMSGMSGFEFVEVTRADPDLRDVPAILVTSRNAPEDKARGKEAGAAAYVVKSEFDQGFLLDTIARLLRESA